MKLTLLKVLLRPLQPFGRIDTRLVNLGYVRDIVAFPEMVETVVICSSDSLGEESPLPVHHLSSIGLFPGVEALMDIPGQQQNEQASDNQTRPRPLPSQQVDQSMTQCEASDIFSIAKQPGPSRDQFSLPLEMMHTTPVLRLSATPMPAQESHPDTFTRHVHRTHWVPRSSAPSLSDPSVTVRSQSGDQQDKLIQPGKTPGNSGWKNDEKSLAQFERDSGVQDENHLPSIRSPSWSPLTTPTRSPLAPIIDIIDEDVDFRRAFSERTPPVERQLHDQTSDPETAVEREELKHRPPRTPSPQRCRKYKPRNPRSRVKGQDGRVHGNGGRRQAAPTRWSPVIPWSPNRKALFHYDVQQRLAAATRGTHIDNGLLKVTPEYFDI
ncbi:hypothetical protein LX32DRAFT_717371 [Colletotrichum zoysiae]|uniref:Uncharacterized protein n=1 Tax=Colletotrichum zoysiae TaxID=1216348 RepID=A0AAD9LT77_9PEZI|nr:hypothetical protein LX32DRAFT_717371 [Colletotrichum zoysiae]